MTCGDLLAENERRCSENAALEQRQEQPEAGLKEALARLEAACR
jgi:hypothetical protein